MKRYLLTYSYIGTNFRGVQKQICLEDKLKPDPESIQGILEICLSRFRSLSYPNVVVSSRTDSGVHALETTAHVDLDHPKNPEGYDTSRMRLRMNKYFAKAGADVWIKNIKIVPDTFHARYNAKSRTYLYRLAVSKSDLGTGLSENHNVSIPMGEWRRCCMIGNPTFNVERLKEAVTFFPGLKDFRTFTGSVSRKPENYSTIRRINYLIVNPGQPLIKSAYDPSNDLFHFWDIVVNAKSFVHRQVRRMVGVLIAVAQNKIEVEEVKRMIEAPLDNGWNPRASSAPAHGLYLLKVEYDPKDLFLPNGSIEESAVDKPQVESGNAT